MTDRDIFLSHSSGDADVARELRAELEAAGYSCWMAPDDVDGTDSWAEQILRAIQGCRVMLVLISSSANLSPHVSREVNLALGRKRAVLPIRIENVTPEASLEYLLSLVQRIDAFPPPLATHAPRILRRLAAILPVRSGSADASTATLTPPTDPVIADLPSDPALSTALPPSSAEAATDGVIASTVSDETAATELAPEPAPVATPASAAPSPAPGVGSRVGGFTIDAAIGEGGMATVYRATQGEPRRPVALKVIRADHAADATYRKRFLAETDTLASLEHPGIVPIYAAGEADGVLFIAMRLIDGPDLASRLAASGRMSLTEAIVTLRPIADAIDYAHEMGVIHRDIKPSNIILDRGGRPYLTDFGLGKHLTEPRDISAPGTTLGTLDYMAPEQFSGLTDPALAGRIDVYALGCVAYACLTGQPPFRADEPQRIMYAHLHGAIPNLRDARPDLPPGVDAALHRALAKNPADRFATADEFLAALTAVQTNASDRTAAIVVAPRGRGATLGSWARANSMLAGSAVTIAALVVVATGVLAFGSPSSSASPGPAETKTSVDPGDSIEPTDVLPTPTFIVTEPPTGSAPPITDPPVTRPPVTDPPVTSPPKPSDTTGPAGATVKVTVSWTTSTTIKVSITRAPSDSSKVCARLATNTSSQPSSTASGWVGYTGGKIKFTHHLANSVYGIHTVYVWFRDCSANRNVSSKAAIATVGFDHAPKVVVDGDCNVHQYVALAGHFTKYWVGYETDCFTDADGEALKIKFGATTYGTWQTMSQSDLTTYCPSGNSCLWYVPNQPWGGGAYNDAFYIWAEDTHGKLSSKVLTTLCVNQTSCP